MRERILGAAYDDDDDMIDDMTTLEVLAFKGNKGREKLRGSEGLCMVSVW